MDLCRDASGVEMPLAKLSSSLSGSLEIFVRLEGRSIMGEARFVLARSGDEAEKGSSSNDRRKTL